MDMHRTADSIHSICFKCDCFEYESTGRQASSIPGTVTDTSSIGRSTSDIINASFAAKIP